MKHINFPLLPRRRTGFSLVELMVALAVGMLLMAGLAAIFVNSNTSRSEIEKTNRQIENGRYASYLLTADLRLAGFYGEFDPTPLTTPTTKPDACATAMADLRSALPLHIQGYDGGGTLSCLSDVRDGTDILVVRHTATCVAGTTDCDSTGSGLPFFQASLCNNATELGSSNVNNYFVLDTDTGALNRTQLNCSTAAVWRRYRVHIYFIANNDKSGDGIPTLKRAELGMSSFSIVPLVEGIENLQVEYGIDTDSDGTTDVYSADPDSFGSCTGADCVENWRNVVAVKVHLLARNTEISLGHEDTKTYTLGSQADGSANTFGPYGDRIKRHAYQSVIHLNNPAGRKAP